MTERIPENMVVAVVVVLLLFLAKVVAEWPRVMGMEGMAGMEGMGVAGSQHRSQGRRIEKEHAASPSFEFQSENCCTVIPFGMQYLRKSK